MTTGMIDVDASAASAPVHAPATIRVLVADDSSAIRTLARYALSTRPGFEVVAEARDGSEALSLYDAHQPDCVVLDLDMPVMGGLEALSELQRRRPGLPVVVLSGFADQRSAERAMRGGAGAYLDKASQLTLLGDTIRRVTDDRPATPAPMPAPAIPPTPSLAGSSPAASSPAASSPAAPSPPAPTGAAELRRFEYVVSHDLAEPMRIMNGFATLLQTRLADTLDPAAQAYLGHIVAAAGRGQLMIDDLLRYSRAGRQEPVIEPIPLAELVATASTQLGGFIRDRGAEVTTGELPVASCDREMVTTVLREVVRNAITFNHSEPPTVHLTGLTSNGAVVVTITDNGIGMAPADCARVLDLFQRLHARDQYTGTGTGLALCRRLLDLQEGALVITSALGVGTTVTLTLRAPHPRGVTP